jgi:hypothetical protein
VEGRASPARSLERSSRSRSGARSGDTQRSQADAEQGAPEGEPGERGPHAEGVDEAFAVERAHGAAHVGAARADGARQALQRNDLPSKVCRRDGLQDVKSEDALVHDATLSEA